MDGQWCHRALIADAATKTPLFDVSATDRSPHNHQDRKRQIIMPISKAPEAKRLVRVGNMGPSGAHVGPNMAG